MHTLVVFIEARPERVAGLRAALLDYARRTRESEPACHQVDVAEDPLEPASFLVYLLLDDEPAWQAHLDGPQHQAFMALAGPWMAARRVLSFQHISDHGQA